MNAPQAPPRRPPSGVFPVWGLVACKVKAKRGQLGGPTPIIDAVIEDMEARDRAGREKYGVPLTPYNGRDALIDLYQEILDACAYSEQLSTERGDLQLRMVADEMVVMAIRVRRLIYNRDGR